MNMTSKEIERAIDYILGAEPEKPKKKRKRGRQQQEKPPVWALEFYNPKKNRTFALISMCIKEDFEQTVEQLALRLSVAKCRPPMECLTVLRHLQQRGKLGYYDSETLMFRTWHGEEEGNGLEDLCG